MLHNDLGREYGVGNSDDDEEELGPEEGDKVAFTYALVQLYEPELICFFLFLVHLFKVLVLTWTLLVTHGHAHSITR